jgi:hypothetical protein
LERVIVPLTSLTAAVIIVMCFPLGTLLQQRTEMSALSAQIALINNQSNTLIGQSKALSTKSAEVALARQEYQLVQPGQRLIQILTNNTSSNSFSTGDPGLQPIVNPTVATISASGAAVTHHATSFWSRVIRSLQFWR